MRDVLTGALGGVSHLPPKLAGAIADLPAGVLHFPTGLMHCSARLLRDVLRLFMQAGIIGAGSLDQQAAAAQDRQSAIGDARCCSLLHGVYLGL